MKNKKKFLCQLLLFTFMFVTMPVAGSSSVLANNVQKQSISVSPYADTTEWIFKVEDGKLYKRLYNSSNGTWLTDWTFVCYY